MRSRRLTGRFTVNLAPDKAFNLFTPRGEEAWAAGWEPSFPVPTEDDSAPGTVFETNAHGRRVIWVVVESARPYRIRYSQLRPGDRAGTVDVSLEDLGGGTSEVTVTYHLTPLTAAAQPELDYFAISYSEFLAGWAKAIATQMDARS
jgi:hypothetical protein